MSRPSRSIRFRLLSVMVVGAWIALYASSGFAEEAKVKNAPPVAIPAQPSKADSPEKVSVKPQSGGVKFIAVGRPSMLRVKGQGLGPAGDLEINGQEVTGRLNVDLSSLTTENDLRDSHMKEKYLEVGKYQSAVLTLKSVKLPSPFAILAASPSKAPLEVPFEGELELHGQKQNVSGKVKLETKSANQVAFEASFPVKLTDYKIGIPSYAGITIAEQVEIEVRSEITRVVK